MTAVTDLKPMAAKQQQAASSRILMDIPCKVCNDHSSGKHYGIYACDGCAGFFKRSIRRNRQYICKSQSSPGKLCTVDKTHRNQCRACRLTKCTDAGMNKDAVQHERGPRNSTIRRQVALYLRETSDIASSFHAMPYRCVAPPPSQYYGLPPTSGYSLPGLPSVELLAAAMNSSLSPPAPLQSASLPDPSLMSGLIASRLAASAVASLPNITTSPIPTLPKLPPMTPNIFSSYFCSPEAVCEAAARLLFMNVRWLKSIPAFLSLPYADQTLLMEEAWRELFVLAACQFQMPIEPTLLISHAGIDMNSDSEGGKSQIFVDLRSLNELISKFKQLQVDPTEYACLKGILIFKTELEGSGKTLSDQSTVVTLQDQAQIALSKYITSAYPSQPSRFGKLLLMLPALRNINSGSIERVFFRKSIGSIPMERLLNDMYKSSEL